MAIYYVGFPLLILAAVFDTTLMTLLRIWGGAPNLVLVLVVSWALVVDLREALPWALIGGISRDLLSIVPTGSSALILILIVVLIDQYIPKLDYRNVVIPPLVVAIATLLYDLLFLALLVIQGRPVPQFFTLIYVILPGLVENIVIVLIVFRLVGGINAFLRPTRPSVQ